MLRLDLDWLSAVQILGGLRGEAWAGETNLVNLVVVSLNSHWAERDVVKAWAKFENIHIIHESQF